MSEREPAAAAPAAYEAHIRAAQKYDAMQRAFLAGTESAARQPPSAPVTTGYGPAADALRAEVDADNAKDALIAELARILLQGGQSAQSVRQQAIAALPEFYVNGHAPPPAAPELTHTREDAIASYNAGYVAGVEKHAELSERELAAALDSFYGWFTVVGGGARVQGQLLGDDVDDFARALHAHLDGNRAHREAK